MPARPCAPGGQASALGRKGPPRASPHARPAAEVRGSTSMVAPARKVFVT